MAQPGSGLGAVLTATDVPLSSNVAPASGVFWGPALAVDPKYGSALGLGPSSNVTPLVGISGVQPKAVDPTRRFGPRAKAKFKHVTWNVTPAGGVFWGPA